PYLGVGVQGGAGPYRSVASRVALGGEAVTVDIRAIEISRDLFWIPVGDFGVKAPFVLGPDEYFILGDNSAKSADSRLWGPIRGASILGRPTRIVWPMDRLRALR
ncbi:MAG: S26 family signal peptidase, partial [Planctomycetota bacterium]|nr:S26 family signal peptidase [Planctomycetota bacterium]